MRKIAPSDSKTSDLQSSYYEEETTPTDEITKSVKFKEVELGSPVRKR